MCLERKKIREGEFEKRRVRQGEIGKNKNKLRVEGQGGEKGEIGKIERRAEEGVCRVCKG